MNRYTITSWNNANPEAFIGRESDAIVRAADRAFEEGSLVYLCHDDTQQAAPVRPDGTIGTWQFTTRTAKEDLADAIDEIEDR